MFFKITIFLFKIRAIFSYRPVYLTEVAFNTEIPSEVFFHHPSWSRKIIRKNGITGLIPHCLHPNIKHL